LDINLGPDTESMWTWCPLVRCNELSRSPRLHTNGRRREIGLQESDRKAVMALPSGHVCLRPQECPN